MKNCNLETSVPDWVIDHPRALSYFKELQIDYCCGGKSLEFACREKHLDPHAVLAKLYHLLEGSQETNTDRPEI